MTIKGVKIYILPHWCRACNWDVELVQAPYLQLLVIPHWNPATNSGASGLCKPKFFIYITLYTLQIYIFRISNSSKEKSRLTCVSLRAYGNIRFPEAADTSRSVMQTCRDIYSPMTISNTIRWKKRSKFLHIYRLHYTIINEMHEWICIKMTLMTMGGIVMLQQEYL
jgi:hypothetical protein